MDPIGLLEWNPGNLSQLCSYRLVFTSTDVWYINPGNPVQGQKAINFNAKLLPGLNFETQAPILQQPHIEMDIRIERVK
jgi:hypothetical protein